MSSMERMPTGITGLDGMIEGGLLMPSLIPLAEDAGAGKTTSCIQFLCREIDQRLYGPYFLPCSGLLGSLFKPVYNYDFVKRKYLGQEISWPRLEDKVKSTGRAEGVLKAIPEEIEKLGPRCIVIGNLSDLKSGPKGGYRRFLHKLSQLIKAQKAVALVTGDALPRSPHFAKKAPVAEEITLLQNEEINLARRQSIEIIKMRGMSHCLGKYVWDIFVKELAAYPGQ